MKLWLLTAMLLLAVPQATQPDAVLERLSKVDIFAFGPSGYAGETSTGEKDYKTVLARNSALADFEKLFEGGNIQAKCYALVGIHKLNRERFDEVTRPLAESKETVTTMEGCIMSHVPFTQVLKRITSGKYQR